PTASRDNISPSADKHETSQLQTKTCSDLDTEKKTSVPFKHIPEFSNNEVSLQDSSQVEGVQASQEDLCSGISRLPHPEEVTAPDSALNSCTVVEGLLFPVEYYVRTTRRMSNCQRKVDLDAVILSQLGRSKKGQRSKCKQKDANSDWPSQERVENDLESEIVLFPFLGAENDPASSSSPQKSLPVSSGSSTSLGSSSQNSVTSTKRDQRRSQRKQKGRRKSACTPPVHQGSQELIESLDLITPRGSGRLLSNECQSAKQNCKLLVLDIPLRRSLHSSARHSLFSFRSLQGLASRLGIRDFHLPDEEFGLLKLEKLESSPVNDLEVFVPSVFGDGVAAEDMQDAQMNPEEKSLKSNLILPFKNGLPKLPHMDSPASKKELSTHELLFTPTGTILAGAPTQPESQIFSSAFPVVGATPAVSPSARSQVFPETPSVPASQASLRSPEGASAQAVIAVCVLLTDKGFQCLFLNNECLNTCKCLHKQNCCIFLQPGWNDLSPCTPDCSSSCAVDVSAVWWEAAGCRELCVVTASESSVSLWKPLPAARWGRVYTWLFGEIPVIQIVPLPDTCNLVCIALGDLEIGEIRWLLLYSSENDSFKQSLVKTGNIKAVLGLKGRRLVSSSRTVQEQQVEIVSVAAGRKGRKHLRCGEVQTLMPPEETVLAFAEVEGMRDALVGTTAVNSVVVWNLKTGQLLRKMHIGYSYPASICHRAYSDAGLLFVVLSHPHAKESESCGNAAFRVIAFNPKTARSAAVTFSSLPPGHAGRYLEGDVKDASAAAVLTSGAIAVWDLLLGCCVALLPPDPAGTWALARWATTTACLLAGQRDGTVCLYRYRQPQPGAA
uniref:Partner and localizer of BRCA2 n=1 Tax=Strix occidentalis caurina TaxID=311401 RepID=A0A8D0FTX9_STROC